MCLEPEFFDARDAAIRTREARGHVEVEHFMESLGLPFDRLYDLGYFGVPYGEADLKKLSFSTADFFTDEPAPGAGVYFLRDRGLQLVFVRARKARALAALLRAEVPFEAGSPQALGVSAGLAMS
jgi:hypothetical protein